MSKKQKLTHGSLEQQEGYEEEINEVNDDEDFRDNYNDCQNCIEADEQLHDLQCHVEDLEKQLRKLHYDRVNLIKSNKQLKEKLKAKYNDKVPDDIC